MEMSKVKELKRCCFKCAFWKQESLESHFGDGECDSGDINGLCKRNAPSPFVYIPYIGGEADTNVFAVWPTTYADDCCGQFSTEYVE